MSKANEPAFPLHSEQHNAMNDGLTKREYFAGLAMQGQLAHGGARMCAPAVCAVFAIECADALLLALSNEVKQ